MEINRYTKSAALNTPNQRISDLLKLIKNVMSDIKVCIKIDAEKEKLIFKRPLQL